jgi:two-component system, LytTR family, sensor histidine kinase AlgZ
MGFERRIDEQSASKMTSIRHFPATHPLPDWRNFGVMLRVLVGVNLLALLAALVQTPHLAGWLARYVDMAALVEPLLLVMLGLLALLRDALRRLPLRLGQALVIALAAGLAYGQTFFWASLGLGEMNAGGRAFLLAAAAAGIVLTYFDLRARAFSPAQSEARLAALNARIRPHFLFNSLNAVLSLIRARPQQAEAALESLSDLFRAAMRDPGELVSLSDEIALGRQYLELEKLRLGERLAVDWQIEAIPADTPIPPLMLQPLLENAVYHGIEPMANGGTMHIHISHKGDELRISIRNPHQPAAGNVAHASGNHMALANIRERLALYYDLEARLETEVSDTFYEVRVILPCRTRPS